MRIIHQQLDEIISSLSLLGADWMDSTAKATMEPIKAVPIKEEYCRDNIVTLMAAEDGPGFWVAKFCVGLSWVSLKTNLIVSEGNTGQPRNGST